MLAYTREPDQWIQSGTTRIAAFNDEGVANIDAVTVQSFGEEWGRFNAFDEADLKRCGDEYFDIVSDAMANKDSVVLDMGCGTGRWSKYLAPRVGFIEAIDPSDAVQEAVSILAENKNVRVTKASVDSIPFADNAFDFIFSLGVFHHIPDTAKAIATTVRKLKPGGTILLYLYYKLDNRSLPYRLLFYMSHLLRLFISKMPSTVKQILSEGIAAIVYFPLATLAGAVKAVGAKRLGSRMPLSYYSDKSYYIMRNDALDRFGTPLEQRFSRKEITEMLTAAGLRDIHFSDGTPYWHVTAKKG